jgi:hypothetical protein
MSSQCAHIATITGQNQFTEWAALSSDSDVSASGVVDSTVTVQRSFDGGQTAKDVEQFTADFEKIITSTDHFVLYRVGVKTGDYGTDTILVEILQ